VGDVGWAEPAKPNLPCWPYSTFHHLIEKGIYPHDWAGSIDTHELAYDD